MDDSLHDGLGQSETHFNNVSALKKTSLDLLKCTVNGVSLWIWLTNCAN